MTQLYKILVFAALLGLFWATGGLQLPQAAGPDDYRSGGRTTKALLFTNVLFVAGAAIAVWGDKQVGTLDPQSLKPLFIILGVLLMLAGFAWMRAVKGTLPAQARVAQHDHADLTAFA